VADLRPEILERKLAFLRQYLTDLEDYARLDTDGRRREHYAIERLLQLLCESAVDPVLVLYCQYLEWALEETAGSN
jgi:uncharacterized protein YutE (UPF0331/DUF86 family)